MPTIMTAKQKIWVDDFESLLASMPDGLAFTHDSDNVLTVVAMYERERSRAKPERHIKARFFGEKLICAVCNEEDLAGDSLHADSDGYLVCTDCEQLTK